MIAALILLALGAEARVPELIYERPPLVQYQLDALFSDHRYAWIEASTKSGKTHGSIAWLTEQAFIRGARGRQFWWVAPVYSQAEIAYERTARAIPRDLRKPNDSKLTLTLPHKAVLAFKSGEKPDNLYGEDVHAGVEDEASRLREESHHAIRSTLTKTRGPLRIIGNVKGRKNWFYHGCRKAEAKEPGHHFARISALDAVKAGIIDAAEVEDARRTLPENVFRELYMAEPSEDGGNPFGISAIRARIMPLSLAPAAAYGIDLAKSVDWTTVVGVDAEGIVCDFDRFQAPWTETIARVRARVRNVPAYVDSTGVGDPILEAFQRGGTGRNYEGYKFSAESKQKLMEGLAVAIQRGETGYPAGVIPNELEAFEYEYVRSGVRYEAAQGMHDDAVCGLALAIARLRGEAGRPRLRLIA